MLRRTRSSFLRRDLNASAADGAAFSLMVGLGETYLPAFVLAIGLGQVLAGLIATVPQLAGAVLQLITPYFVRRLGSPRRWVIICAATQGAAFLPLLISALYGHISGAAALIIATIYWGSGLAAGPAWNTWMGLVVPRRLRSRYFALRTRIAQIAVLIGLVAGGLVLQTATVAESTLHGFAILFSAACLFRAISVGFLIAHRDPERLLVQEQRVRPHHIFLGQRPAEARLLTYMFFLQLTTHLAAAFFNPYMLKQLHLSYATYVMLLAASFLAKIAALPWLGVFAARYGARRLLWLAGLGVIPLAGLWLVSDAVPYLLCIQLGAGVAWGAYELATFLLLLETIRDEERTSIMTTYNLTNSFAVVAGSLTGGWMLMTLGETPAAYLTLFLASSIGRLLTLPLLARVYDVPRAPVDLSLRTIAVRPSAGSIDLPVAGPTYVAPAVNDAVDARRNDAPGPTR